MSNHKDANKTSDHGHTVYNGDKYSFQGDVGEATGLGEDRVHTRVLPTAREWVFSKAMAR